MMDTKEQGFCYKNPNSTVSQEITQTVYQFHHLDNFVSFLIVTTVI